MQHTSRDGGTDVQPTEVFAILEGEEPMLTEEIQALLGQPHQTMVDKLERLHERGLIERKAFGTQLTVWWLERDQTGRQRNSDERRVATAGD